MPFDLKHMIKESVMKTNALILMDEDIPGGSSAYMLQQILDKQDVFDLLELEPKTLSARAHRSAYDGDYYCKPNINDLIELAYHMQKQRKPNLYPLNFSKQPIIDLS